jgi:uncharacterized protein (TIGR02452 family)
MIIKTMADTRRKDNFDNKRKHWKKKTSGNDLVKVWHDTLDYIHQNHWDVSGYKYKWDSITINDVKGPYTPHILVENIDTFNMACNYAQDHRVLALNMASDYKPGGGVRNGKTAQEEELFRRSNAFFSHKESFYPLEVDDIVYSPELVIIKDDKYKYITPQKIGMIACAALRKPKLTNCKYNDKQYEIMSNKIDMIFRVGAFFNFDCLVLGALGCGVFCNPPEEVAQIFKKMIDKYGSHFKVIAFAVLKVGKNGKENFSTFKRVLIFKN